MIKISKSNFEKNAKYVTFTDATVRFGNRVTLTIIMAVLTSSDLLLPVADNRTLTLTVFLKINTFIVGGRKIPLLYRLR